MSLLIKNVLPILLRSRRGMSLLKLVMSISIMSILLAVAVPYLYNTTEDAHEAVARSVYKAMNKRMQIYRVDAELQANLRGRQVATNVASDSSNQFFLNYNRKYNPISIVSASRADDNDTETVFASETNDCKNLFKVLIQNDRHINTWGAGVVTDGAVTTGCKWTYKPAHETYNIVYNFNEYPGSPNFLIFSIGGEALTVVPETAEDSSEETVETLGENVNVADIKEFMNNNNLNPTVQESILAHSSPQKLHLLNRYAILLQNFNPGTTKWKRDLRNGLRKDFIDMLEEDNFNSVNSKVITKLKLSDESANGRSMLHLAAIANDAETINAILGVYEAPKAKYEFLEQLISTSHDTALCKAVSYDNVDAITALLTNLTSDEQVDLIQQQNIYYRNALHKAAELPSVVAINALLTGLTADQQFYLINDTNISGETALKIAAYNGNYEAITALLKDLDNDRQVELIETAYQLARYDQAMKDALSAAATAQFLKNRKALAAQDINNYNEAVLDFANPILVQDDKVLVTINSQEFDLGNADTYDLASYSGSVNLKDIVTNEDAKNAIEGLLGN